MQKFILTAIALFAFATAQAQQSPANQTRLNEGGYIKAKQALQARNGQLDQLNAQATRWERSQYIAHKVQRDLQAAAAMHPAKQ